MMEIIKPEEILAELEKIAQKDLECVYVKTNAFDIYLNDATTLKMDTNKGVTGIYFVPRRGRENCARHEETGTMRRSLRKSRCFDP